MSNSETLQGARGFGSAWAATPNELQALGLTVSATSLFGQLHRTWRWGEDGPLLGRHSRARLASAYDLSLPRIVEQVRGSDGATRVVLELADGLVVEALHMPREVRSPRVTLCLSTQVGCSLGCRFCATGGLGLTRNLTAGELVGQVLVLMRGLGGAPGAGVVRGHDVTLVFMGMGEPLLNVDAVCRAIAVLCDLAGLGLSPGRITVSTAGVVPGLERLAANEPRPDLAVSLTTVDETLRRELMPVSRKWSLAELREVLGRWPFRHRERVILEVVLLRGINDRLADADALVDWVGDLPHNINVIAFNQFPGCAFEEPEETTVQAFIKRMQARGCMVTLRASRGRDAGGACGQLVGSRRRAATAEDSKEVAQA